MIPFRFKSFSILGPITSIIFKSFSFTFQPNGALAGVNLKITLDSFCLFFLEVEFFSFTPLVIYPKRNARRDVINKINSKSNNSICTKYSISVS